MINVIGLGYIGLPTALMLAACGNDVTGTDLDDSLVKKLNNGQLTFQEEGLSTLYHKAVQKGIRFTDEYIGASMYIIAVPTPYRKESKKIETEHVVRAVERVLNICPKGAILVIESTISPGTIHKSIHPMVQEKGFHLGEDLHIAHAPERIIPGSMVYELEHNSRTIGADSREIAEQIKKVYATFCKGEIVLTDVRTAEMTKVVENTFRDINIAFANELAKICRSDNMDVHEIIRIANKHPRVNILSPGPGVGGHCISVDPWFLVGDYPGLANIILAARKINDSMPEFVLNRVHEIMSQNLMTDITRVGFYGLTYKENVDDIRESPTIQLLDCMKRHLGGGVRLYDPYVDDDIAEGQLHDLDGFLEQSDLVVIMVAHEEIMTNRGKLGEKIILDTRHVIPEGTNVYYL